MANINVIENLNRARKLIQMDDEITKKAKTAINEKKIKMNIDENGDYLETPVVNNSKAKIKQINELDSYQINENTISNLKGLPEGIMESFKSKRIDTSSFNPYSNGSVLDDLEKITGKPIVENKQQEKQIIVEQSPIPQVSNVIQPNIDYSMIKLIVEDCMKKNLLSIKKSLNENKINENNNTIQALKIGDKFSFITENGDLYEAKLEFKKNIKKK